MADLCTPTPDPRPPPDPSDGDAGSRMTPAESRLRDLYATPLVSLMDQLPAIAERHHAQLHELHRMPAVERCERLASEIEGLRRHLQQLRQSLLHEAAGGSPSA